MSEARQGVNIYGHQVSDGGLEEYANKVTGREGVSVGVQCSSGISMNKGKLVLNMSSFGVHYPLSVSFGSPDDDDSIANLVVCKE